MKMLAETLLRISFFCDRLQGKCTRINLSQSASGMILQNHRRLPVNIFSVEIPASGFLKDNLEGYSKLVSNFKESS
jgi:hypothetical protein